MRAGIEPLAECNSRALALEIGEESMYAQRLPTPAHAQRISFDLWICITA